MTAAILIAITSMWVPVGLLFLGKGEAKGSGAVTGFVGAVTVLGAFIQAAVFKDALTAGLLFAHGLLYCTVAYALLNGLQDLRSVGNVSLVAAVVSLVYMLIFLVGGPLVTPSPYLALMCAGYVVLTVEVWLNAYGKFPANLLAWSLIVWAVIGLLIPAFWLLVLGKLPF